MWGQFANPSERFKLGLSMAGTRIRDLGIRIGRFQPGPFNAIADIEGIRVGHTDIAGTGLLTGLTAVIPFSGTPEKHKLFLGRWTLDGGAKMSGLPVAEDFGTFSGPIVLAPAPAFGGVYDGVISYGHRRDAGLPIDAGWPPVIVGIDDGTLNDRKKEQKIGEAELLLCFGHTPEEVAEGSSGIGRGLCAFGLRGGVGTSSRLVEGHRIGILVAANGGERPGLRVNGVPVGRFLDLPDVEGVRTRSVCAIVATDAPMGPDQLNRLAGRSALGLARGGFIDGYVQEALVLAFSTGVRMKRSKGPVFQVKMIEENRLPPIFEATAEAAEEAGLNGLLSADPGRLPNLTPDRLRTALDRANKTGWLH